MITIYTPTVMAFDLEELLTSLGIPFNEKQLQGYGAVTHYHIPQEDLNFLMISKKFNDIIIKVAENMYEYKVYPSTIMWTDEYE